MDVPIANEQTDSDFLILPLICRNMNNACQTIIRLVGCDFVSS